MNIKKHVRLLEQHLLKLLLLPRQNFRLVEEVTTYIWV